MENDSVVVKNNPKEQDEVDVRHATIINLLKMNNIQPDLVTMSCLSGIVVTELKYHGFTREQFLEGMTFYWDQEAKDNPYLVNKS